jgi:hypothetical protein
MRCLTQVICESPHGRLDSFAFRIGQSWAFSASRWRKTRFGLPMRLKQCLSASTLHIAGQRIFGYSDPNGLA